MPDENGGLKAITADKVKIINVKSGDRFFIASDGVVDNYSDKEIEALMQNDFATEAGRAAAKATLDANLANKSYKKPDDYSYVPIEFTA